MGLTPELAFRGVLFSLAVLFLVIWFVCVLRLNALDEIHHAYIGAFTLLFWPDAPLLVVTIAVWIIADDAFEHLIQVLTGDPTYRSPGWHLGKVLFYDPYYWLRRKLGKTPNDEA